jgi:L-threonylcarbamoyladenylate synthase
LSKIVAIEATDPDAMVLRRAADILHKGGLLVIPTRHLYGLAVDALNPRAVQRVFEVKQRPLHLPLLILIATRDGVDTYAMDVGPYALMLMKTFWPGKLTIILKARPVLPSVLTGGTGRIGIRLAEHAVGRGVVAALQRPITATSANLSGQPGCHRIEDLHPAVLSAADLVLDAGALKQGRGSTVVDVQPAAVRVLRQGAVGLAAIRAAVQCPVVLQDGSQHKRA